MVAPRGSTKEATSFRTPRFSSAHSRVTGRVAALELVEKASNWAGAMPKKNSFRLKRVKKCTIIA